MQAIIGLIGKANNKAMVTVTGFVRKNLNQRIAVCK